MLICASFLAADDAFVYRNDCKYRIIFNNLEIPSIIDLVSVGFGNGFDWQERIIIKGKVFDNPDQFEINLAGDGVIHETANIQLHFNPRFHSPEVLILAYSPSKRAAILAQGHGLFQCF